MPTAQRKSGAMVELERPRDWPERVVGWRVIEAHAFETRIAARVRPLKTGPRGMIRSRSDREGWAFFRECDGAFESWGDHAWTSLCPVGEEILVCHYFDHRIERLSWPELEIQDDLTLALSQCGIEALVLSPTHRLALACLNSGQGENGYELFETSPLRHVIGGPGFGLPVMGSPLFSPDERKVLSVIGANEVDPYNHLWWVRPDPAHDYAEDTPSPGGVFSFVTLLVHDIETKQITRHAVDVALPEGWLPPDVESLAWTIPDLASVERDHIELALPGGMRQRLPLPLAEKTELKGLGTA